MGYIQICESGSTVDCYVEGAASNLTAVTSHLPEINGLLLGALVLVGGLIIGKYVIKLIRP